MFKKQFGKPFAKLNEAQPVKNQENPLNLLDTNAPLIYTFQVDKDGVVKFLFKCDEGLESEFGMFLDNLVSGHFTQDILESLSEIFPQESFNVMLDGMGQATADIMGDDYDETPLIMPSQVFSGVDKT